MIIALSRFLSVQNLTEVSPYLKPIFHPPVNLRGNQMLREQKIREWEIRTHQKPDLENLVPRGKRGKPIKVVKIPVGNWDDLEAFWKRQDERMVGWDERVSGGEIDLWDSEGTSEDREEEGIGGT